MRVLDVLIVSERPDHLRPLVRILAPLPARLSACFTIRQAQQILIRQSADLVLCDEHFSDGTYCELLLFIRFRQSMAAFVPLLSSSAQQEYASAIRLGAFDVLHCPLQQAEVESLLLRTTEHRDRQLLASASARSSRTAGIELTQQDILFQELLAHAALQAAKNPVLPTPLPRADIRRPEAIRKDVA